MKIYQVPSRRSDHEHDGYSYYLTITEAKKAFKENNAEEEQGDRVRELILYMNKWDVIQFLNEHCSYPDNG